MAYNAREMGTTLVVLISLLRRFGSEYSAQKLMNCIIKLFCFEFQPVRLRRAIEKGATISVKQKGGLVTI